MSEQKTKARNWQRILLVASLAVNLAVVGIVAGTVFGGGSSERLQRFDLSVGPLTRAMEDTHREAVRNQLRESGAFRAANRNGMRRDASILLDTLRAEMFDAQAFVDIMARQRTRQDQGQSVVLEAVTAQISLMDTTERRAFADRIQEQLRRSPPRRDR